MNNNQSGGAYETERVILRNNEELREKEQARDQEFFDADPESFQRLKDFVDCISNDLTEMQKKYPEVWKILFDIEETEKFAATLTPKDFEGAFQNDSFPAFILKSFTEDSSLQEKLEALRYVTPRTIFALWDYKQNAGKKHYRTKKKADSASDVSYIPEYSLVPTFNDMEYALSLYQKGNAYLQPLKSMEGLKVENGTLFFENARRITEAQLKNLKTKEYVKDIDLGLLRILYSIYFYAYEQTEYTEIKENVNIYFPDLAERIWGTRNTNAQNVEDIIQSMQTFRNIVGVISEPGTKWKSYYKLLNFNSYDAKTNVISFNSPYLTFILKRLCELRIRRNKKGDVLLKKNGDPQTKAIHSFYLKAAERGERNRAAVENVVIIVQVIERAGSRVGNPPNITARKLIERNELLKQALEKSTNKNQLLKRCFKKTWELLPEITELKEKYKNIELPDPKNKRNIPTMNKLDIKFEFKHQGKNKGETSPEEEKKDPKNDP